MGNNTILTVIIVIICLLVLIFTPLFLDLFYDFTVRSKQKEQILQLARESSRLTGKPIIVFNDKETGVVIENGKDIGSEFHTNILDAIEEMQDNSAVLIVSNVLEYINPIILRDTIRELRRVSGDDLYVVGIGRTTPRTIWDYKIKTLLDKSFYLPKEQISWFKPNIIQTSLQNFYQYLFNIIPYDSYQSKPVVYGQSIDRGYA